MEVAIQGEGGATRLADAGTGRSQPWRRFARWSCERRSRGFAATQAGPDGVALSRDGRGAHPLLRQAARRWPAPRAVRAGGRREMELRDRWRIGGIRARVCVRPPGARRNCSRVRLRRDSRSRPVRVDALRPGGYRITARTPYQRLRRAMRATPRGGRLKVLATGDSMIQIIDSYLQQRIGSGRTRVRSDAHISTGISKPSLLDWPAHAMRRARGLRPDVIVMFLGANDGFAMRGAACCGRAWRAEYARRARGMMRTYARGGRSRVYWLLLPAPRGGAFRQVYFAVNAALRRAARGLEDDVRLIDLVEVFTPGWRYRDSMRIGGRTVRVRQSGRRAPEHDRRLAGRHARDPGAAARPHPALIRARPRRPRRWAAAPRAAARRSGSASRTPGSAGARSRARPPASGASRPRSRRPELLATQSSTFTRSSSADRPRG